MSYHIITLLFVGWIVEKSLVLFWTVSKDRNIFMRSTTALLPNYIITSGWGSSRSMSTCQNISDLILKVQGENILPNLNTNIKLFWQKLIVIHPEFNKNSFKNKNIKNATWVILRICNWSFVCTLRTNIKTVGLWYEFSFWYYLYILQNELHTKCLS